jgi:hypothetical protein
MLGIEAASVPIHSMELMPIHSMELMPIHSMV